MSKRLALIGTFALVLTAFAMPARAETRVSINIGAPVYRAPVRPVVVAPVVVAPPPVYPGYLWQPEHYVWTAYGYQFVPGMWVPAPYVAPAPAYVVERPQPRGLALGVRFKPGKKGRW